MNMRGPANDPPRGNGAAPGSVTSPARAQRALGRGASAGQMPAEHALLGLIALTGGKAHGYDLARYFDLAHPLGLGDVLHLEQSMLYQHLKKLERRGWLDVSLHPQGARPPRQMYRLTEDGRAALRRWLAEPVARTREIRLEFLVKLFFAFQLDRARANHLVAHQREVCQGIAADLVTRAAALDASAVAASDREARIRRMVLELRLEQTRAAAAWLQRLATWTRPPAAEDVP